MDTYFLSHHLVLFLSLYSVCSFPKSSGWSNPSMLLHYQESLPGPRPLLYVLLVKTYAWRKSMFKCQMWSTMRSIQKLMIFQFFCVLWKNMMSRYSRHNVDKKLKIQKLKFGKKDFGRLFIFAFSGIIYLRANNVESWKLCEKFPVNPKWIFHETPRVESKFREPCMKILPMELIFSFIKRTLALLRTILFPILTLYGKRVIQLYFWRRILLEITSFTFTLMDWTLE